MPEAAAIWPSEIEIELEAMFVEPVFIGNGFGRLLMEHAKSISSGMGAKQLIIQSDPYAIFRLWRSTSRGPNRLSCAPHKGGA